MGNKIVSKQGEQTKSAKKTIRLSDEVCERLDRAAIAMDWTDSGIIREALLTYLEERGL